MSGFQISEALGLVSDLATLIRGIANAVASKDPNRIEEVVPRTLRTTIAKQAKDVRARMVLGSIPPPPLTGGSDDETGG